MNPREPPVPPDTIREEVGELDRAADLLAIGRASDRSGTFPRELFRELGRRRLLGLTIPVELGGRGLTSLRAARGLFELALRGGTLAAKLSLQPEFSSVLASHGGTELRDRYFAPLIEGERIVGNQLTEAGPGSDLGSIETRAVRRDDNYLLTGEKTQVAFADVADSAIVYGRASAPGTPPAGISAWLVPQATPGIERRALPDFGERWMRRGTVRYTDVPVSPGQLIGAEDRALEYVRRELDHERALLGAVYLGVGWAAWAETVQQVADRRVGGRPLSSQEAVSFPLVEDRVRLVAAWGLLERTLSLLDEGTAAAGDAALAKWYCGQTALTAVDHAMHFHGGAGYSEELPFAQRLRDLRSARVAHGTDEVMHLVAARELWPKERTARQKN
ncbi:MAG TPA: acyl-CoA dehydrogenase family protein [Thermoplasmata archaeon]|nr:acyl-CoA dehydrogenase family protein [Thermoplasmata archaeon]